MYDFTCSQCGQVFEDLASIQEDTVMAGGGHAHHRRNGVVPVITVPFRACLGLNTRSDPSSLAYDPQTSSWEAARLLNLDVLDGGRRWRNRPGYSVALQFPAPPHSPQVDGDIWYVAAGDTLYRVAGMVKTAFLTDLTPGLRLGWCRLGQSLYWSNAAQQGRITDGQAKSWGGIAFSSDDRENAEYATVPAGNVLAAAAGRIWIGVGNDVVYTVPGYPHHVRVGSCRLPQSSAVRMIYSDTGSDDDFNFKMSFIGYGTFYKITSDDQYLRFQVFKAIAIETPLAGEKIFGDTFDCETLIPADADTTALFSYDGSIVQYSDTVTTTGSGAFWLNGQEYHLADGQSITITSATGGTNTFTFVGNTLVVR